MAAKYPEWTPVQWPYNSAITLPCFVKNVGRHTVYLHQSFKLINSEANNGNGEWVQGEGFDFTVKTHYTGRCPDTVKTIEEAQAHIENLDRIGKLW